MIDPTYCFWTESNSSNYADPNRAVRAAMKYRRQMAAHMMEEHKQAEDVFAHIYPRLAREAVKMAERVGTSARR